MIPHIRWEFRGRRFQPVSLATALSMLVLAVAFIRNLAVGDMLDGPPGDVAAGAALVAAALLAAGWWGRKPPWHSAGLFLAAGVWMAVTVILLVDTGWSVSAQLGGCWVIGTAGAWLIEVDAHRSDDRARR